MSFADEDNEPAHVKNPEDLEEKRQRRSKQLRVSMMQNLEIQKAVKEVASVPAVLVATKSPPE